MVVTVFKLFFRLSHGMTRLRARTPVVKCCPARGMSFRGLRKRESHTVSKAPSHLCKCRYTKYLPRSVEYCRGKYTSRTDAKMPSASPRARRDGALGRLALGCLGLSFFGDVNLLLEVQGQCRLGILGAVVEVVCHVVHHLLVISASKLPQMSAVTNKPSRQFCPALRLCSALPYIVCTYGKQGTAFTAMP